MDHVLAKLEALGSQLPFPHQRAVRQGAPLRELRPRSGRSPWRGLYTQVDAAESDAEVFVLLAIGPEAGVDPQGFHRAVQMGLDRFHELTPGRRTP